MMTVLFRQLRENPTISPKLQPESRSYHSFGPPICHCPPPLLFFLVSNDEAANVNAHKHGVFPKLQKLAVLNVAPFPTPRGIGFEAPAPLKMMGKSVRVDFPEVASSSLNINNCCPPSYVVVVFFNLE
ncbi:unnamed protein product [Heterosigma akashiwo]